jgi:hypothetical protein
MKKLMILIASAGLIAGCAKHTESNQGGAGYQPNGSMGTGTNTPPQGTQGGTTDQGTTPPNGQP